MISQTVLYELDKNKRRIRLSGQISGDDFAPGCANDRCEERIGAFIAERPYC
jgi:hypothetical protein